MTQCCAASLTQQVPSRIRTNSAEAPPSNYMLQQTGATRIRLGARVRYCAGRDRGPSLRQPPAAEHGR